MNTAPHFPEGSGVSRRLVLAAAVGAGLGAAGCSKAPPAKVLTVAAFPLVDEIVRAAAPAWQRLHPDVAIEVVSRQYVDHHTAMTTALSTSVYLPDVMALEASYVGRFSLGQGLDNLNAAPYNALRLRERFVPYAFDGGLNRRQEVVAIPTDIGPGTLLYRHDLLAQAGLKIEDLSGRWEDYVDAGIALKAKTGAYLISSAQVIKDILIRSDLAPGEGLYFDRDSRVLVESPRFVRAFELARRVRQHQLDAKVKPWTNDWAEGFRRGTLATDLTGAWMVGQMANWVAPDTRTLWRAAQLPQQTFVGYGGTYYALPRRARPEFKALAWDLVQLLTLNREQQFAAFKSQDAFPALVETFDDPFFAQPLPFLGGQPARLLWREAAGKIHATEVHKQSNFADEVIGTELDNVLEHGKPIAQALAQAARLLAHRAHR
jgi:multiple sugar transport system substrate-binding protein